MLRAAVSLGDLLTALGRAAPGQSEWAARAVGYERRGDALVQATASAPAAPALAPAEPVPEPVGEPEPEPVEPATVAPPASPHYWRVLAQNLEPIAEPVAFTWLQSLRPGNDEFVSDLSVPMPPSQPLVSRARAAVALRRILATRTRGRRVDVPRVVSLIAAGRTFRHLPMESPARWPSRLQVLVDTSERLRPLALDYAPWLAELHKTLRGRMRVKWLQGLPVEFGSQGRPYLPVALSGSAVLVLGDAGLYGDAGAALQWSELSRNVRDAGGRTVVVAPMPARLAPPPNDAGTVVWRFDETGVKACPGRAGQAPTSPPLASDGLTLLRAALFGNPHVSAALLRRLRMLIARHGWAVDLGDEVAVWHDPSVVSSSVACRLDISARDGARRQLLLCPRGCLQEIVKAHWQTLLAGSPLVRAEYALRLVGLIDDETELGQVLAAARESGDQLMRRAAAVQWRADGPDGLSDELSGFIRHMERRGPELLQQAGAGLRAAWVLANRDELTAGLLDLPAGIDPADLQILAPSLPQDTAQVLGVSSAPGGDALVWWDGATGRHAPLRLAVVEGALPYASVRADPAARSQADRFARVWRDARLAIRAGAIDAEQFIRLLSSAKFFRGLRFGQERKERAQRLRDNLAQATEGASVPIDDERSAVEVLAWFRCWSGAQNPDEFKLADWGSELFAALEELQAAQGKMPSAQAGNTPATVTRLQPFGLDAGNTYRIEAPGRTLWVDAAARPEWADEMRCERGVLMACVDGSRSPFGKRWLRWVPAGAWPVRAGVGESSYQLPNGCWWDADEAESFLFGQGEQLRMPPWAARHGVDEYGYWAEFEVRHIVQRMRFIPPGRFWMGSPLAEAGRFDDEALHPVTLTRGYWLADTACAQAVWQAVAGELPKGQRAPGSNLPVVDISHDDVLRQFMPALELHAPGFAGRLPTEGEWEYAARAGTATAYPWGEMADSERMNFQSDDGKQTTGMLPVRNFPANTWGLWQMHGNVWEWCADGGPNDYASDEVLDPNAAAGARRVLRGGSWFSFARNCRSGHRNALDPGIHNRHIGFRLARGLPEASWAEPGGRGAPVLPAEPAASSTPLTRAASAAAQAGSPGKADDSDKPGTAIDQMPHSPFTPPPGKKPRK